MSIAQKVIKPKLGLLGLAKQLGNISAACRSMGYSRDTYYRFRDLYAIGGKAALHAISRKKPIMTNRVDPSVEKAVVDLAIEHPAYGQLRVFNELKKSGVMISPGGVRCIWLRHGLHNFKQRLKALEAKMAQENLVLTASQLSALEKHNDAKEADGAIETEDPSYLGSQDTYYIGTIKGTGKIYQQTFIDTYSRVAQAKLYTEKTAITAADLLNDKVIPFFATYHINLLSILTDRGTEYCGKLENHAYQLYLNIEDIDHTKTKAYSPQTNGICERFHKTIKEEFYDGAFRRKIYHTLEELQLDLDNWLVYYNEDRTHSGKYCYGKTPMQTFLDSKQIAIEKSNEALFYQGVSDSHGLTDRINLMSD